MQDAIAQALVTKIEPILYLIGLVVVLGILSFGGTIISIWLKARDKKEDHVISTLNQNSLAIARLEAKFDMFIEKHDKDINNLGRKVKDLSV